VAGHHELVGQTGHHSRRVEEGVVMGSGGQTWLSLDSWFERATINLIGGTPTQRQDATPTLTRRSGQ